MSRTDMTFSSMPDLNPFEGVDFSELDRSLRRPRTLFSVAMSGVVTLMTMLALIPLFSVVLMLLLRGGRKLSLSVFTQLPPAPLEQGGGFGNALQGTLMIVALAVMMSVPVGILSAIYLAESERENRVAYIVRYAAKILT